jgi:hypothetical protein
MSAVALVSGTVALASGAVHWLRLLSTERQQEILSAAAEAEQRIAARKREAEMSGQALQWIDTEMTAHVVACTECRFRACRTLRRQRRLFGQADRRYRRALRQLRGGR